MREEQQQNKDTHMTIAELRQKRASLIEEVRKVQNSASNRALNADELKKVDDIEKDIAGLEQNIQVAERQEKREKELAATSSNAVQGEQNEGETRAKKYAENFRNFLLTGERRDLSADTAAEGGNIVVPTQLSSTLIKKLDDLLHIRQFATKETLTAFANLGVPTITADPSDADWTTEVQSVSADSTMAFGKRTMAPAMLSKLVKVSMKLLQIASRGPEEIVNERLAYKFAVTQEKAFLTGNGTGQPLGIFTASANGINTDRDVSTDNTTSAITSDGLQNALYSVKAQYRKNGKWLFHRDAVKMIRKLKTGISGDTTYVWQAGLTAGQPDTLLGYPVLESEYVPNTFTTGLYVGAFADLTKYMIVDQIPYTIQRLNELYAGTNQIGFIGRLSTDGAPVDSLGFARVKLG
jgi:HK97 family phage major capsid protein